MEQQKLPLSPPKPSAGELMAFYRANKAYVDLIVQNAVENNPQLKQLREENVFRTQLEQFKKEFPDSPVQSAEDLMNAEEAEELLGYVQKGLSLSEAYKLCHYDQLVAAAGQKGKKAGMTEAGSKAHLRAAGGMGSGAGSEVPADVKAFYHALLEDWSESDIAKHYHKK